MPPKPRKPPPRRSSTRNRNLLLAGAGAAAVVVVLIVASVVLAGRGGGGGSSSTTADAGLFTGIPQKGVILGGQAAPVTLIQFEDIQCPICREYQEQGFSDIVKEYVRPGKVKLRFAGIPIIGADSEKALYYVLAAGKQDKLWQYMSALYANQGKENSGWVTEDLLHSLADDVGLDWAQLKTDAASTEVRNEARTIAGEAARRQVPGTPTFFVQVGNGTPYLVQPTSFAIESFRPILDDALSQ